MQILYQIKDDILLYFKYETYDINKLTQKCLLWYSVMFITKYIFFFSRPYVLFLNI